MRRRYKKKNEPYPYPFTRVAVRVMRYYNSVPLTGAMRVMAPFRGCANTSLLVVMILFTHRQTNGIQYD